MFCVFVRDQSEMDSFICKTLSPLWRVSLRQFNGCPCNKRLIILRRNTSTSTCLTSNLWYIRETLIQWWSKVIWLSLWWVGLWLISLLVGGGILLLNWVVVYEVVWSEVELSYGPNQPGKMFPQLNCTLLSNKTIQWILHSIHIFIMQSDLVPNPITIVQTEQVLHQLIILRFTNFIIYSLVLSVYMSWEGFLPLSWGGIGSLDWEIVCYLVNKLLGILG